MAALPGGHERPCGQQDPPGSVIRMTELKQRLRADLSAAIKARDPERVSALRMALAAVSNEEVSGDAARELSDDQVRAVLGRETKKRREAAEAYSGAGRAEQAAAEQAEAEVLREYLPAQLDDEALADLVAQAVDEVAAELGERPGPRQMGRVMKSAQARVAGRAEGARVAAAVKAALAEG